MADSNANIRPPPAARDAGDWPRSAGFLKIWHLYLLALLPGVLLAAAPAPLSVECAATPCAPALPAIEREPRLFVD